VTAQSDEISLVYSLTETCQCVLTLFNFTSSGYRSFESCMPAHVDRRPAHGNYHAVEHKLDLYIPD
jgi:hypothetical protein